MEKERSLVLAKPDAVQRGLVGEIMGRMERVGLKLVAIKMVHPTVEDAKIHYELTEEWGQGVYKKAKAKYDEEGKEFPYNTWKEYAGFVQKGLIKYISSGPIVAMVWEGVGAVALIRKMCGKTDPFSSLPGTIRGDFAIDSFALANEDDRPVRNLIHASGTPEEAEKEIKIWFTKSELHGYEHVLERVLYDPSAF